MSSVAPHPREQPFGAPYWAFTALLIANVAADIWMPDSTIARLVSYAFLASGAIWFGLRVRTGYRRRRPYWTRESWLRYGRLAAMPVAAIVFALAMSTETGMSLMGPARSTSRNVWATVVVLSLLFGTVGLVAVLEWLMKGDPAQQFTRTSWLLCRGTNAATQ